MAPTPYKRTFSFTGSVSANPNFVPAAFGVNVDAEFDQVAATIAAVEASLALIQRADGALANGIVTPDSLNASVTAALAAYVAAATAQATLAGQSANAAGSDLAAIVGLVVQAQQSAQAAATSAASITNAGLIALFVAYFVGLPTVLPAVPNQLWWDGGVLARS